MYNWEKESIQTACNDSKSLKDFMLEFRYWSSSVGDCFNTPTNGQRKLNSLTKKSEEFDKFFEHLGVEVQFVFKNEK